MVLQRSKTWKTKSLIAGPNAGTGSEAGQPLIGPNHSQGESGLVVIKPEAKKVELSLACGYGNIKAKCCYDHDCSLDCLFETGRAGCLGPPRVNSRRRPMLGSTAMEGEIQVESMKVPCLVGICVFVL